MTDETITELQVCAVGIFDELLELERAVEMLFIEPHEHTTTRARIFARVVNAIEAIEKLNERSTAVLESMPTEESDEAAE